MKPKNFPERKNQRRIRALDRMKVSQDSSVETTRAKISATPLTSVKTKKAGRRDGKAARLRFI